MNQNTMKSAVLNRESVRDWGLACHYDELFHVKQFDEAVLAVDKRSFPSLYLSMLDYAK